jgi:hypothetical protein
MNSRAAPAAGGSSLISSSNMAAHIWALAELDAFGFRFGPSPRSLATKDATDLSVCRPLDYRLLLRIRRILNRALATRVVALLVPPGLLAAAANAAEDLRPLIRFRFADHNGSSASLEKSAMC